MSSERPSKDRPKNLRVIKKLDFENCVFSGIKTGSKCKRRLRARYVKNVESVDKNMKAEDLNSSLVFASPFKTHSIVGEKTSPLLLTKKSTKKNIEERCNTNRSSPVFRNKAKFLPFRSKRKIDFGTPSSETATTSFDMPKSPIFKRSKFIGKSSKTPLKTKIKVGSTNFLKYLGNHIATTKEITNFESEKFEENSYRIEESSQESKQSLHISPVSSLEAKIPNNQMCPLDAQTDKEIISSSQGTAKEEKNEKPEGCGKDLPPCRKNFKKSGRLLEKLHTILKKQNSERLLWQHQDKKKFYDFEKLSLLYYWIANTNFVLKCISSPPESEIKYLVVDKKLVPDILSLKKRSLLHLYPPWVNIKLGEERTNVMINVVFLEILEETSDDFVLPNENTFESIPPEQFKGCEDDLLINSFFSFYTSPYLL